MSAPPKADRKTPLKAGGMRALVAKLDEILADVPEEEWAKLPADMSETVDEVLTGAVSRADEEEGLRR